MNNHKFNITCEVKNHKAVVRIEGRILDGENVSKRFECSVNELSSKGIKDIDIYIDSPGGSVFEANEITNILLRFSGFKTARLGKTCASAATYIASKCDKVIASPETNYMIHKPMMLIDGNASEIESALKILQILQTSYAEAYSKKTGMTVNEINSLWKEEFWMSAKEALEMGFVDEIENAPSDSINSTNALYQLNNKLSYNNVYATSFYKGEESRVNWTYEDYQNNDPKALAEMAKKDQVTFKRLFKANYGL